MKCKYCKKTIEKLRKDSVTCGDKECRKKYNRDYIKYSEKAKEYNKKYQKATIRALWKLSKRHLKEFRKLRKEERKWMEKK